MTSGGIPVEDGFEPLSPPMGESTQHSLPVWVNTQQLITMGPWSCSPAAQLLLMFAASSVCFVTVAVDDNRVSPLPLPLPLAKQTKPDCPYCDSSVFPYCSDKLLHDACCCLDPYDSGLPPQCQLADCSFLHANTCKEHRLITRCCCNRLLYVKR